MSVIHFPYLRKKRTIALVIILTLTSALFSITAYSFLGFYNGFTNYVGEKDDVLAVYSTVGSTPFTGIIPLSAVNTVASLHGVEAVSPEVIAPSMIGAQSVFIRGILPDQIVKMNPLVLVGGEGLALNDFGSTIVGQNFANRLHLKVGDQILVQGVLAQKYVELRINGIYQTASSLNDEALVSICVGQWLRGLSYDQATVIRAKIDLTQTNANKLHEELKSQTNQVDTTSPSPTPKSQAQQELETLIPITSSGIELQNIGIEQSQEFMQSYLNRYGISKDSLIVLSTVVLILASGTATSAITLYVRQHNSDIEIIRSIGVTSKKVKLDFALRITTYTLIATVIGTLISAVVISVFQQLGYLEVISHSVIFQLDPLVVAANFILLSVLVCINIARMELKQ
jgi:ABC-type lipoprotein release transport system permease subunit